MADHKKLPLPLTADKYGLYIWGRDSIMVADFGALRMRGWGYLTGGAALKLSEEEAIEIQKAWQAEIVKRVNVHDELIAALAMCHDELCSLRRWARCETDADTDKAIEAARKLVKAEIAPGATQTV